MDSYQLLTLKEVRDMDDFGSVYSGEIGEDELVKGLFDNLKKRSGVIEDLVVDLGLSTKGVTERAHKALDEMVDLCLLLSISLKGYGFLVDFMPFKHLEGCSPSELKYGGMERVLTTCEFVSQLMRDYEEQTVLCGITVAQRELFDEKIDGFRVLHNAPVKAIRERAQVNRHLNDELRDFRMFRDRSLKPYMKARFAKSNVELYEAWVRTFADKVPRGKRLAIRGSFRDAEGRPVRKVRVQIDNEPVRILGSDKGGFYIRSLSFGEHVITFSLDSYLPITMTVLVIPDRTAVLDVVFESVPIVGDGG